MQIGLTLDEYVDLKVRPRKGADAAFREAAEQERAEMFPMTLTAASSHLRSRGYDCRPEMLEVLVRNQVVTPTSPDAWSQADVDAAAEHFEDCDMFTPYAAMCQTPYDIVPADAVVHWFRTDRSGQHRGIPELTPALPLFAQLRRYTLAVIAAAETAADFAAVLFTDAPAKTLDLGAAWQPLSATSLVATPGAPA